MLQEAAAPPVATQVPAGLKRQTSRRPPKPWTADERELVVNEYRKGASKRAIAKLVPDRTFAMIEKQLRRCRHNDIGLSKAIKPRRWTAEERKKLLRLNEAGAPLKDVMCQFPDRTLESVNVALFRLREDISWCTARPKRFKWTATAEKDLIERLGSGSSLGETATFFGCSIHAIRQKLGKLGFNPLQQNRAWTPEEDKALLRMGTEGYARRHISSHLGRSVAAVTLRWCSIRPTDPPTNGKSGTRRRIFNPLKATAAEKERVERLRQEGATWQAITASVFPGRTENQVYHAFVDGIYKHQREKIASPRRMSFSPSDMEDIESLLKAKKNWKEIVALKFPDREPSYIQKKYYREIGRNSEFAMPFADIPEVKRLRNAGLTWKEIADAKYPGIPWLDVRARAAEFLGHMNSRSEELGTNAASTGEEVKKEEQEEKETSAR